MQFSNRYGSQYIFSENSRYINNNNINQIMEVKKTKDKLIKKNLTWLTSSV